MNQIIRITIGLTISCLIAATVMGSVFMVTDKAKKHNEHMNVQATMLDLLGYGKKNTAPPDLQFHSIYRYIMEDDSGKYLGYLLPVTSKEEDAGHTLLTINLDGRFNTKYQVPLSPEEAIEAPNREEALRKVLKPSVVFNYADATIVAEKGGERVAYLLPGKFPGFKTFIVVMLALNSDYEILGLEIMEHEEDPGLGADIEKEFFKNQFKNKDFKKIKELQVIKEPLPEEYKRYLETRKWEEGEFTKEEIEKIRSSYQDQDIHALTGATISSKAVTDGVKGMVKKFAYRIKALDDVISNQEIAVAF